MVTPLIPSEGAIPRLITMILVKRYFYELGIDLFLFSLKCEMAFILIVKRDLVIVMSLDVESSIHSKV